MWRLYGYHLGARTCRQQRVQRAVGGGAGEEGGDVPGVGDGPGDVEGGNVFPEQSADEREGQHATPAEELPLGRAAIADEGVAVGEHHAHDQQIVEMAMHPTLFDDRLEPELIRGVDRSADRHDRQV